MIDKKIIEMVRDGDMVCLTGAGISADSGIATFRGRGGFWEKYNPDLYASSEGLLSVLHEDPCRLADFIVDFYSAILTAGPNQAHLGLALLEKEGFLSSVITQNIDNLHQRAGSRNVIELHGNAFRLRCAVCGKKLLLEKDRLKELCSLLASNRTGRRGVLHSLARYFPRCACGRRLRIDVVLFGEILPEEELNAAFRQLDDCRTLLLIGTSGVVYPAAGLPGYAKEKGAKIIEINPEPTALSAIADYRIAGNAAVVLPEILKGL